MQCKRCLGGTPHGPPHASALEIGPAVELNPGGLTTGEKVRTSHGATTPWGPPHFNRILSAEIGRFERSYNVPLCFSHECLSALCDHSRPG